LKQSKELSPLLLSDRAKLLLEMAESRPSAQKVILKYSENNDQSWIWNFELDGDKILTLDYQNISANQLHLLFLECLLRMAVGKTLLYVQKINFREVENYLRDENHLTAFSVLDLKAIESEFIIVQNSLLVCILLKNLRIEMDLDRDNLFNNWAHLSLVVKNSRAHLLINALNKILPTQNPLELTLAENATISIILNDFPMDVIILQALIDQIFRSLNLDSSLKVVAVQ